MQDVKIEIKKRNRDFGIVTWPYKQDFEVKTLLELKERINIEFGSKVFKNRKVSYKYRRFSIGKKRIESLSNKKFFVLSKSKDNIRLAAK